MECPRCQAALRLRAVATSATACHTLHGTWHWLVERSGWRTQDQYSSASVSGCCNALQLLEQRLGAWVLAVVAAFPAQAQVHLPTTGAMKHVAATCKGVRMLNEVWCVLHGKKVCEALVCVHACRYPEHKVKGKCCCHRQHGSVRAFLTLVMSLIGSNCLRKIYALLSVPFLAV